MVKGHLPDTWFCNVCNVVRGPPIREAPGAFGKAMALLEKRNSSAFSLPRRIRDYFEGVRTGAEGEYEEGPVPAAVSKAKCVAISKFKLAHVNLNAEIEMGMRNRPIISSKEMRRVT